jgi:uncharacterized membrane protein YdfJ with MMPL/SSD domain
VFRLLWCPDLEWVGGKVVRTVPIASYVPLMMFAALFGLSMDYEVFLVSQIAQHHAAGESPRQAVRSGVASSAMVLSLAPAMPTTDPPMD